MGGRDGEASGTTWQEPAQRYPESVGHLKKKSREKQRLETGESSEKIKPGLTVKSLGSRCVRETFAFGTEKVPKGFIKKVTGRDLHTIHVCNLITQVGSPFPWNLVIDLLHCLFQKITDDPRKGQCNMGRASRNHERKVEIKASVGCSCEKWLEYKLLHCRTALFTNRGSTKGLFVHL